MVQVLPALAGTLGWAVRQLPPTLSGSNKTEVTKQYWNLFIPENRNTPVMTTHKQPDDEIKYLDSRLRPE